MALEFRRKNIRLPAQNYLGQRWYFITICCQQRRRFFVNPRIADWLLSRLREEAARHSFAVHAYCVMPDHLHLLVWGTEESSDLLRMVERFKQRTAHEFKQRAGQPLWQAKFYDHILRGKDAPEAVAWYIWLNPVRGGLCKEPREYPFSGSFVGNWYEKQQLATNWQPPWKER